MELVIASVMNKIRIVPRQAINLNVNPNSENILSKNGEIVKVQIAKAKSDLIKAFAQKPDEYVSEQASIEVKPKRLREMAKLPKHRRTKKGIIIPKKRKKSKQESYFEQDMRNFSIPFISEEEQKWINIALRYHNKKQDFRYKTIDEHYQSEIELGNLKSKIVEDGYAKAVEDRTKAYFDTIKADDEYKNKLYWNQITALRDKPGVVVNVDNKLLFF